MWEYSHYLLFLQAISLFLLDSFSVELSDKVFVILNCDFKSRE